VRATDASVPSTSHRAAAAAATGADPPHPRPERVTAIEAIEATRLPAITPGPSYFRAAAGRRPLVAVVRSIEVGEVVHVCKNAQNTARASHEKKAYSTPWYRPSTWSWEAEAGWPAGSEQDHALFAERGLRAMQTAAGGTAWPP